MFVWSHQELKTITFFPLTGLLSNSIIKDAKISCCKQREAKKKKIYRKSPVRMSSN